MAANLPGARAIPHPCALQPGVERKASVAKKFYAAQGVQPCVDFPVVDGLQKAHIVWVRGQRNAAKMAALPGEGWVAFGPRLPSPGKLARYGLRP